MEKKNRFEVEYAKSNMATCRVCMAKIPKGVLRIGHVQVDPRVLENNKSPPLENDALAALAGGSEAKRKLEKRDSLVAQATRWHHFECFPRMKGARWMTANLPKEPDSVRGLQALRKADQRRVRNLWKATLAGSGVRKVGAASSTMSTGGGAKTRKRKGDSEEKVSGGDANRPKKTGDVKKSKLSDLTSVQGVLKTSLFKKIQRLEEDLAGSLVSQLQAELAKNDQVRSGSKGELVRRVAEGRVLGALPPCPRCSHGRIHWNRVGGWYSCPGYHDREANVQRRCNYRSQEMLRKKWKPAHKQ